MAAPPGLLLAPLILSLSLDTFAVSTAIGIAPLSREQRLRFAGACVLAEAAMPLVGLAAGGLIGRLGAVADWLSVALLLGAGLWIVREALAGEDEIAEAIEKARDGGADLPAVALGVSLDELAVGMAFGALRLPVWPAVAAIAVQAAVAGALGLRLGAALGARAGARAALLAGLVLCLVALGLGAANAVGR